MAGKFYTIRPGDNLLSIAKLTDCTVEEILALNPQISNPNVIYSGAQLLLPDTVSRSKMLKAKAEQLDTGDDPAWLKIARGEMGITEIGGSKANPRIVEYLWTTKGLSSDLKNSDETAWCSAFANWCIVTAGLTGTSSAWALDWRNWGKEIANPVIGAVVVFSRKSLKTNGGHVGFFIEDLGTKVRILGGNQSESVKESTYPKDGKLGKFDYKLLNYRMPS
jgi:TIGR02594 family protein